MQNCCCPVQQRAARELPFGGLELGQADQLRCIPSPSSPESWLFPQCSFPSLCCAGSSFGSVLHGVSTVGQLLSPPATYTLRQGYRMPPFGATCLLISCFRPLSDRAIQQPAGLFLHAELVTKLIEGHLGGWCYAEFNAATLKHMPPSPSCCTFFQFVPFFSLAAFQKPYTAAPCS